MSIFDEYGFKSPTLQSPTVLYVGDYFGFTQLARYLNVVTFQPNEIPTIFEAVQPVALVVTPLAGRNANTKWTSLGTMASLSEFSEYSELLSAADRKNVPVIGWLHNEPTSFDENTLLAEHSDLVWTADARSAKRHTEAGRQATVVRNLPSDPLPALEKQEILGKHQEKKLGVALQDFSIKGRKTSPARNYGDFFHALGFDYIEWTEFARAKAKMYSEESRWALRGRTIASLVPDFHFVAYRANSGIKQAFDFLTFILDGSFPVGIIDPSGGKLHKNPLSSVFSAEKLRLHTKEEIAKYGVSLIENNTYWTYWTDIVISGLFGHDLIEALVSAELIKRETPTLARSVKVPVLDTEKNKQRNNGSLPKDNMMEGFVDMAESSEFDTLQTAKNHDRHPTPPRDNANFRPQEIRVHDASPSKRTVQTVLALSRYTGISGPRRIPVAAPGKEVDWIRVDFPSETKD